MSNTDKLKRKLPWKVRHQIEEALSAARLERCAVNEEAKKAMQLYLETWVAGRLMRVLSWDDGESDPRDWRV